MEEFHFKNFSLVCDEFFTFVEYLKGQSYEKLMRKGHGAKD
jgi:hypothetical protein